MKQFETKTGKIQFVGSHVQRLPKEPFLLILTLEMLLIFVAKLSTILSLALVECGLKRLKRQFDWH